VAIIGVENVEIRIYKAEELVMTLTTDPEGRADTMLEADTYRVEYWFKERKVGEHEITLEVDSYVVWSFPALLMAIVKELLLVEEVAVKLGDVTLTLTLPLTAEGKLGDVAITAPLTLEVEAAIVPEFYPSLNLTVEVKLGDVTASQALSEAVAVA